MNYKFPRFFYALPFLSLPLFFAPSVGMAGNMPADSIGVEKKGNKILVLYKVEAGETLSSISRKYNTNVEAIRAENSLSSGLKLGDVIKVPYTAKASYAGKKVHTVGASQTLYSIARQYNVTLEDIKKWNNLTSNEISLGQQLVVGEDKNTVSGAQVNTTAKTETAVEETAGVQPATPSTNAAGKKVHVVEAQQGLFSIARSYNIPVEKLRKWNNLTSDNLKLGQELLLEEPEQALAQASRQETVQTPPAKEPEKPKEKEQSRKERKQAEEKEAETQTEAAEVETNREEPGEPVASTETRPSEKTAVKKEDKPESYTIANTSGYVKKVETGMAEVIESGSSDMFLALHRTAPVGTIMQVRNQMNDLSVFVKVIGKLPDTGANDKVIVKLSKKAYERLAALDKRFRVELSYMP
ncbi:LysM peptidoglycan-binding domain-containing protein [Rhodocytophaga rosea]|uniref:LysM peptidoglycan-binding domain-containing protein n=1 Tax=Rhodocytophaga rosea TaxID=2704465 RepID=A0A6C0GJZ6_9BACT|nr:LysM peptidoglycan-binding domain-containing protein [Rhodocytophaga rosea]QHT68279.1 LysM peptidoglycan-binding domain-containing protein [Rhodocytophaga rosea]